MMSETGFCGVLSIVFLQTFLSGTGCSPLVKKHISAELGANVTLECGDEGRGKEIDWYRSKHHNNCSDWKVVRQNGNAFILCDRLTNKKSLKPDFKDRFSLAFWPPSNGNVSSSLTIEDIETKDRGTYFCVQSDEFRILSTSELSIPDSKTKTETSISPSNNHLVKKLWVTMALTAGCPLLLVSLFLFTICLICRKRNLKHRLTMYGDSDDLERQTSSLASVAVNRPRRTTNAVGPRLPDVISSFSSSFTSSFISSTAYSYDYPNAEEAPLGLLMQGGSGARSFNGTEMVTFRRSTSAFDDDDGGSYANVPMMTPHPDTVLVHIYPQSSSSSPSSRRSNVAVVTRRLSNGIARMFSTRRNRPGNGCRGDAREEAAGGGYINEETTEQLDATTDGASSSSSSSSAQLDSKPYVNQSQVRAKESHAAVKRSFSRSVRRLKSCPAFGRTEPGRQEDEQKMALLGGHDPLDSLKEKLN